MKKKTTEPSLDRYCSKCGKKMLMTIKTNQSYFERKTGKYVKIERHYWRCPDTYGLAVLDLFSGHDVYDDDPMKITVSF